MTKVFTRWRDWISRWFWHIVILTSWHTVTLPRWHVNTLTMTYRHWHIDIDSILIFIIPQNLTYNLVYFSLLWIMNIIIICMRMCRGCLIRSVRSCVDVSADNPTPTTFTHITFSGPLLVYFTNTHAHERSLREVNMFIKTVPCSTGNTWTGFL